MPAATTDAAGESFALDAFQRGRFHLVQPARGAHRAGMDALVLAAAVPSAFAGRLADLGAGAGAAGLAVAARLPSAHVALVEKDAAMADCAARTIAHPANAALSGRLSLLVADVGLRGAARRSAGLTDRSFDFVIANPPFNDPRDRASPDALRQAAHVAVDGLLETWMRSAAALLAPTGCVALITRPESLDAILAALAGRFGGIEIRPVHASKDRPAIRIVLRARRGSRARLALLMPLLLHEAAGGPLTAKAEAIAAGEATLFGD